MPDATTFAQFLASASGEVIAGHAATSDASITTGGSGDTENDVTDEADSALTLADVVASLYRAFPEVLQANQLRAVASGDLLAAHGAYDTKLFAQSLSEPTGYYQNYRNGLGLARQTWWGGYVSAGYRLGRGFYQPWNKERQTDDGGEFKIGIGQPLLQGRAIDAQRVAVFRSSLDRQSAEPKIRMAILQAAREASAAYWQWVSSGAVLIAQNQQLALAEKRGVQYLAGVEAGKFAEIDLLLNQQLIAERKAATLRATEKYRSAAFKLGLYLRDAAGEPQVPSHDWLPARFPRITPLPEFVLSEATAEAIARRPETTILDFEMRQVSLDRSLARNQMLPRLDFIAEASQDLGEPATKSDDKGEFELIIGFQSELPIQRRKAIGKIQSTSAKIAQINEKLRLTRDKIATEIQTAHNRLDFMTQIVAQNEVSMRTAYETLQRYQYAFEKGKIDLIYLNLLEVKTNETEIKLVESQREWFSALAELQLSLGLDPLDQAMKLSTIEESDLPGPGQLPEIHPPSADELELDWQRHDAAK